MSEEFCREVAARLRSIGLNAVTWDSGGGNVGVGICPGDVPPDELRFFFGTADSTWAGEVLDEDGEAVGALGTMVSSDSENAREVVLGILQALADFTRTRP